MVVTMVERGDNGRSGGDAGSGVNGDGDNTRGQ